MTTYHCVEVFENDPHFNAKVTLSYFEQETSTPCEIIIEKNGETYTNFVTILKPMNNAEAILTELKDPKYHIEVPK